MAMPFFMLAATYQTAPERGRSDSLYTFKSFRIIAGAGKAVFQCDFRDGQIFFQKIRNALFHAVGVQIFKGCLMQETFADTSAFPGAQGCGACNVCQGNFLCIVVPDEFQNGFCLTCSLPAPGSSFPVSAFFRKYGKKSTPAGEKTGLYMQLPYRCMH